MATSCAQITFSYQSIWQGLGPCEVIFVFFLFFFMEDRCFVLISMTLRTVDGEAFE